VLGEEFDGVLGCDYFSAYRKYMSDFDVAVQFCLAHLIRDVKFLLTLSDKATQNCGRRLLDTLRALFAVIHRREQMTPSRFERALARARSRVLDVGRRAPPRAEARNLGEQAVRFVVIDRRVTQGTRSERGRQWSERIWTVIATCAQQGRSVFDYLRDAITAHLNGRPILALIA